MSKPQETSNLFAVYEQDANSVFANVEKTIPIYNQAVTSFQQEYLKAYENAVVSVISLQKEIANKTGIDVSVPNAVLNVIRDVNKQAAKSYSVQNQSVLALIDAAQQNIKALNDNVKTFVDMNKNVIQFWIQPFTPFRNN